MREQRLKMFEHFIHQRLGLADGQAAYGYAVLGVGQAAGKTFGAEVLIEIALNYGKERLVAASLCLDAALEPARGELHRRLRLLVGVAVFRTLVELHYYVGAEVFFYFNSLFGREQMARAIDMRIEIYPLFLYLVELGEGKYLKSAAVGEDGSIPVHELVQTARLFYHVVARAHIQVIGVGKNYLAARLL